MAQKKTRRTGCALTRRRRTFLISAPLAYGGEATYQLGFFQITAPLAILGGEAASVEELLRSEVAGEHLGYQTTGIFTPLMQSYILESHG